MSYSVYYFQALGVIDSVGKNITKLKAGQPVLVFAGQPKAYAEYLVSI